MRLLFIFTRILCSLPLFSLVLATPLDTHTLSTCVYLNMYGRSFLHFCNRFGQNREEKNQNPPMCHYVSIAMSWEKKIEKNNIKNTYAKIAKVVEIKKNNKNRTLFSLSLSFVCHCIEWYNTYDTHIDG